MTAEEAALARIVVARDALESIANDAIPNHRAWAAARRMMEDQQGTARMVVALLDKAMVELGDA